MPDFTQPGAPHRVPAPTADPTDPALPTETRILLAAIEEINDLGLDGVRVRGVAARAGVNLAAINYYFRSKDRLLDEAIEQTLRNAFEDWLHLLQQQRDRPLRDRLAAILREMVIGARRYPGVAKAQLHGPFQLGEDRSSFARWFRRFLAAMRVELMSAYPAADAGAIGIALVRLVSAFLLPPLLPDRYWEGLPSSIEDDAVLSRYIDQALDDLFRVVESS